MKPTFLILLALLFTNSWGQAITSQRPNIVVFIVDDMGWEDTSLPFYEKRVPNNDIQFLASRSNQNLNVIIAGMTDLMEENCCDKILYASEC